MKYDFNRVIERRGTCSNKWDRVAVKFPKNPDALPMWVADMDFQCPQEVVDAVVERAKHPIYGYGYRDDSFLEAMQNWVEKRHGWRMNKEWITYCGGAVPALSVIINAVTKPGDKVIVQTPVYYPFFDLIINNGRYVSENPLKRIKDRYEIDFDDLEAKAADPKATLLILCNPHNPVSRVFTKEELIRLGEICMKHNVIVAADELHSDLVFKPNKHIPFASICHEFAHNSYTIYAPSKTFNLAGMQASAVIAPSRKLYDEFIKQITKNRTMNISLFGVTAFVAAYKYGEDYLEQLLDYLWENYQYLDNYLKTNMPCIRVIPPEGTYLFWLDCTDLGISGEALDDFFVEAKVALDNGAWFRGDSTCFMRINIACPRATLQEALKRIQLAYDKHRF